MFEIQFYCSKRGECPFQSFVQSTEPRVKAKFIKILDILEEHGPNLKRPYADFLRAGIYELRVRFGTNRYRAFYYYVVDKRIVITHGIVKKTDEVPPSEIEKALRYREDFEGRRQQVAGQEERHA